MKEFQVRVGDINLQVQDYEQDGETILFLHFGSGNLAMWEGVVPLFQDHYRLLLIDLRGHGKSDKPPTGYHIDEMAADVLEVMDRLQVRNAHLVGSSLGAETALSLAAHHPERVISLVCEGALSSEFGPYGTWDKSEAEFNEYVANTLAEMHSQNAARFDTEEDVFRSRKEVWEKQGMWNPVVEAFTRRNIRETGEGKFASGWPEWVRDEYMRHYFLYRFEEYYRQVKCPVLMLPAENDMKDERSRNATLGLSKLAPSIRIVEIPGWQHVFGWMTQPEIAGNVVLKFLSDIDTREK